MSGCAGIKGDLKYIPSAMIRECNDCVRKRNAMIDYASVVRGLRVRARDILNAYYNILRIHDGCICDSILYENFFML